MQTFLPYADMRKSLECLDYKRLGKQRVEARQIVKALRRAEGGWVNHPAVRMWRGYEPALIEYGNLAIEVWKEQGYRNAMVTWLAGDDPLNPGDKLRLPPWFGNEAFHLSHRSNLVRKLPEHYGRLWPDVPGDLEYVWPV